MDESDIAQKSLRFSKLFNAYKVMRQALDDEAVDPNIARSALANMSILINSAIDSYVSRLAFRGGSINYSDLEKVVEECEGTDTDKFRMSFIRWKCDFLTLQTATTEMVQFLLGDDELLPVYHNILMKYNRLHPKPF